jgi:hypothetical protein
VGERGNANISGRIPLRTRDGACRERPPRFCSFGTLAPGERAVVRGSVRADTAGRYVNTVAVNTSTRQRTTRGKRARAVALVRRQMLPRFTG